MVVTLAEINGKVNLQEANLLENRCYHCNIHLEIGHGHGKGKLYQSSNVVVYTAHLTYCDHIAAQISEANIYTGVC